MLNNDEIDDEKRRLWDNLNRENTVDVRNNKGLHRLLTFIEMPSFLKESTHTLLPDIPIGNSLINQEKKVPRQKRPSYFLDSKDGFTRQHRIPINELVNIVQEIESIEVDNETGYYAITPEIAVALRQMVLGSLKQGFTSDWLSSNGAYFSFKNLEGKLAYSLFCEKPCTRSFLVIIQAFFLKNLLFTLDIANETRYRLLNVTEGRRNEYFIKTISELLWLYGDNRRACVCLLNPESYIDPSPFYSYDNITEKIQIFKFKSLALLTNFIRKKIHFFTTRKYPGFVLFLYSAILSKGLQELLEDFNFDIEKSLFPPQSDYLSQTAIMFLITGHASEYLHNGAIIYDPETNAYLDRPQYGVKKRSRVGYLQYTSPDDADYLYKARAIRRASEGQLRSNLDLDQLNTVGSMLKTPLYPIWITNANSNYGVIFCLKDDLLNHWRAENNFKLYYLNNSITQHEPCILDIHTRRGRTAKFKTSLLLREEKKRTPLLNHVINTKWYGCRIEWNGQSTII